MMFMVFLRGQRLFILRSLAVASRAAEGNGGSPGDPGFVLSSFILKLSFSLLRKAVPLFLLSINPWPLHIVPELGGVSSCS